MSSSTKKMKLGDKKFTLTWSWRDPHLYVNRSNSRRAWAPWSSPLPEVVKQEGNLSIAEAVYILTQAKLNIDHYENYLKPAPKLSRQQLLDFINRSDTIDADDANGTNTEMLINYVGLHGLMTEARYNVVSELFPEDDSFRRYKFLFTEMNRDDELFVANSKAEISDSPLLARFQCNGDVDEIPFDTPMVREQPPAHQLGHTIALVGTAYMTAEPKRYYFELQNSWGSDWANDGFSVIERGRLNKVWSCKQII